MAIQTESYYSVMYDEEEVDKIGLSDTLDNYTAEDIQNYVLCGCRDKMLGGNLGLYNSGGGSYDVWNSGTPFAAGTVDYTYMHMFNGNGDNSTADLQGRYCGTVLLTDALSAFPLCVTSDNIENFKLITELDIKNYCMNISATLTQKGGIGATDLSDKTNSLYCIDIDLAALYYRYGTPPVDIAVTLAVVPYHVLDIGGELFLINGYKTNKLGFSCRLAPNRNAGMEIYPISSSADDDSYSLAFNNLGFGDDYSDYESNTYAWAYGYDTVNKFGTTDAELWYQCYFGILMFDVRYYYTNYDQMMMQFANTGLLFKVDGVVYKPLISDNVVYGYTDNLDAESDIDNWERDTKHDIPVTPPEPPPPPPPSIDDEDNKDPVNTTGAPFSAGLCHYYALTAGSTLLEHISEALGTWDIENTHKDLYKNLVSCKLIKPPAPIPTTGSAPFTIYGVKPQYEGADITLPVVSGNPEATFGPYTINRKFGDFRDYAPYTRVSIFLPYCGWCDLPSHVVGRSVTVKYFTDIIAATCKAVVFCNDNIIAEAAGVIGLDIPFVADNVGAKMQAVTAGMIAALGGGIQLGAGIGTMVSTKSGNGAKAALSGASQYLSGYSQMAMAFNENTTEISGKNGDGCCLAGATNIIIKIVRPKKGAYTTAPFTPPGYGHNVGFVSQKQVKVSSVSGLLIADNVDTSGISGATEAERAEIKRVLETGLIVNAAPE